MLARLRSLLIKTPVLVGLGLIVAYLLFAYFAFPPLAKWAGEKYIADKSGHVLQIGAVRFDPWAVSVQVDELRLAEPDGTPLLGFKQLFVDFEAKSLFKWAYVFDQIRLTAPTVRLELRPDGRLNWSALIEAFKDEEEKDSEPPRLVIRQIVLEQGAVELSDHKVKGGSERRIDPLDLQLSELSTLPEDKGAYAISARTGSGELIRWKGAFSLKPDVTAHGQLQLEGIVPAKLWPYLQNGLSLTPLEGTVGATLDYRLAYAEKRLTLEIDRLALEAQGLRITDRAFVQPVTVRADRLTAGLRAHVGLDETGLQARLSEGKVQVDGIRVLGEGQGAPWFSLQSLSLEGAKADLGQRQAGLARIRLGGGNLELRRGRDGALPLLTAFQRRPSPEQAPQPAKPASESAGWQFSVDSTELADFQLAWHDETVSPAAQLKVERLTATVAGLSQDLAKPLPVTASFQVPTGGAFEASGEVVPAAPSADLKLALTGLALRPAQPYVGQFANLSLLSGAVSSQGRFRYDPKGLDYQGGFAVRELLLNEAGTKNRFLAWRALSTENLRVSPKGLRIRELRLDGLGAKFIIYEDKSVNLKRILKQAGAQPAAAKTPPSKAATPPRADGFRVDIERIRVANGEMDFADHSLQLPFGTHIHKFRGAFNGISSRPGAAAQLELDGQVDDHGLARAVGQIDLFDPTRITDIRVLFRNVEMTRLTPYSATFAGRKINSGKLSLDLEYKIQERQLLGENQIIMDKLTLGERVESPTAKNLPLDLAIAILQDSDGRIDLGLPVSGSLDDPEFSYGQIVWKAIVNVITKIVTAPFRALGNLLGAGGDKFDQVAFDAGSARLLPPEREKLKQLVQALEKRPKLTVAVQGTWAEPADRAALKAMQIRREVAKRLGLKLAPGEDPGPLATADPEVDEALADLYAARVGKPALAELKARYYQANPEQQKGMGKMLSTLGGLVKGKPAPLSEADRASLKGVDLGALLYQGLHEREPVADAALLALATQRGEAIVQELLVAQGLPKARLRIEPPVRIEGETETVAAKLSLAVLSATAAEPESRSGAIPSDASRAVPALN